ncbi:hypothetical protein HU200_045105 [Digitaria exilis]|uniref:F-box domain-containing protein n=1 Tax=Digitaria exilis TaxID=1010633 RepID=A0A835B0Y5_9POAL|nr:hypothetical protein HU200_045105 [Digitaria exilis]
MRTRSLSRRIAEAAIATANQFSGGGGESGCPWNEWRDWANLPSELLEEIAGRLLTADVSEYLRFRSACKPWRDCTDDPNVFDGGLDPRFRPHNWIAVPHCGASPSRRRLINTRTGAIIAEVDHSELSTHRCFGVVDGLLVLCEEATGGAVRLLNPLTGALARFPAITDVRDTRPTTAAVLNAFSWGPLTRDEIRADEPEYNYHGKIVFHTLLSFRGHCYVATHRGDVMRVDLQGPPRMVYLSREMALSPGSSPYAYLVRSQDHRMLMVRYLSHVDLAEDSYQRSEIFTLKDGVHCRVEVFEVDVVGRRLIPLNGVGKYAVFVGRTYSIMLPSDKFPKLAPDAVYFNFFRQQWSHLGIYHFKDRRISPPREFTQDAHHWSLSPCACHWELADYLIHDIERW